MIVLAYWDDTLKLVNVVFFLKDTTPQLFDNDEEEISSCDGLHLAFAEVFGKPQRRRQEGIINLL